MAGRDERRQLGQFIPIQYHFNMLDDERRTGAFEQAIDAVVRPGMKVVELGGGTGVLSFFAAQAGAAKVWCVEYNPELLEVATALMRRNEVSDIVSVVDADALEYLPPEPVDVVICEMLHVGLLRERQEQVINSFLRRYRDRFGPPAPQFVPEAVTQAIQPVQQDFVYRGCEAPTVHFQDGFVGQRRTVELAAGRLPARALRGRDLARDLVVRRVQGHDGRHVERRAAGREERTGDSGRGGPDDRLADGLPRHPARARARGRGRRHARTGARLPARR
jgi:phospholipid N-methyltransferase